MNLLDWIERWKGVLTVLVTLGLGTFLSIYMVHWLTADVSAKMEKHNADMSSLATSFQLFDRNQSQVNGETLRVLRRICENTAKSDVQREACR